MKKKKDLNARRGYNTVYIISLNRELLFTRMKRERERERKREEKLSVYMMGDGTVEKVHGVSMVSYTLCYIASISATFMRGEICFRIIYTIYLYKLSFGSTLLCV